MLNLSNELIFTCANNDSAQIASKNIGEREVVEKSWGWTGGRRSTNYQRVIKPYFPAYALRKLPKFTAVVRHCEKRFRKRLIPPIHSDGSYPRWFTNQRPEYAQFNGCGEGSRPFPHHEHSNSRLRLDCCNDWQSSDLPFLENKGQDHAIFARVFPSRARAVWLKSNRKTAWIVSVSGPTGVGKTQLTLEFAHYLFGDNHVFRFDMSEFLHLDNVKLFMGDEAGRTGRLGEVLSKHQKGVLLFDEIEKAHRLIWDLFLQMLDAARITLADHRAYDLSGFYIVCTSNIGSQQLLRPTRLPFTTLERAVIAELHRFFRPELIGRFDEDFPPYDVSEFAHPIDPDASLGSQ